MKTLVSTLGNAARNRLNYIRTVAALERLSLEQRLDIDIYQGDIRHIARRAVYGA